MKDIIIIPLLVTIASSLSFEWGLKTLALWIVPKLVFEELPHFVDC